MKIRDILAQGKPTLSFEVFPPKTEAAYESVEAAAKEIAKLKPSFMSVTYGAGGGTSKYTVAIASMIQDQGVTPLAHLTCVSSTKEKVHQVLEELKEKKIENILALRGDIPADGVPPKEYRYASQLIREIKESGDFCIGAEVSDFLYGKRSGAYAVYRRSGWEMKHFCNRRLQQYAKGAFRKIWLQVKKIHDFGKMILREWISEDPMEDRRSTVFVLLLWSGKIMRKDCWMV